MPVTRTVVEYTVNAVPESACPDFYVFAVRVVNKGRDRWAVMWHGECLSDKGKWHWEPQPSSRTEEWLGHHRFTEQEALRLAEELAPKVSINGQVAADVARNATE